LLATIFLSIFIWWVRSGQSDDLETPARRMLFEDAKPKNNQSLNTAKRYE
jgi:cbb3-type cytochrome oxidase maturation protein